jgi:hypothetical protein
MNYFAHAVAFLDKPYFLAGTAVPDWLGVVDRTIRIRSKHAALLADDTDPPTSAIARGILQHFRDDARFHETRAFAELLLELTALLRDLLADEGGFRPSFLAHLLMEVLVDASLIAENPAPVETYYRVLDSLDAELIQRVVNRMTHRPTTHLAYMIERFCQERILWDYLEDDKLLVRLNQVMHRVGFAHLPDGIREVLPQIRRRVAEKTAALLEQIPALNTQGTPSCDTD